MGPNPNGPQWEGAKKLLHRYSGLGVRSVGPVGDFLDKLVVYIMMIYQWWFDGDFHPMGSNP